MANRPEGGLIDDREAAREGRQARNSLPDLRDEAVGASLVVGSDPIADLYKVGERLGRVIYVVRQRPNRRSSSA